MTEHMKEPQLVPKEHMQAFELTKSTFKSYIKIHLLTEILQKTYIFSVSFSNPIGGAGHN